jgi:C4-dicarboxylate-specific signal transduction histidine kinase
LREADRDLFNTLDKGLEAIKIRSEGLYNFTQSYRKLTGIPKLSLTKINLKEVVQRVVILMENKIRERNIRLQLTHIDAEVVIDPDLMQNVLIKLLLNDIDAVAETKYDCISITSSFNTAGCSCIRVGDIVEGIYDSTAEKVYIPFFTTRKNG